MYLNKDINNIRFSILNKYNTGPYKAKLSNL